MACSTCPGNSATSFTGGQSYTIQGLPTAPTGLVATPGDSHIALNWNAVSGATTYNVKRSLATNTGYSTIATSVSVTNYDDTSLTNGTPYFYKVSAVNGRGEGADSSEVTATPAAPPAAPGPVSIAVGDTKVILSWPAVPGATSSVLQSSRRVVAVSDIGREALRMVVLRLIQDAAVKEICRRGAKILDQDYDH